MCIRDRVCAVKAHFVLVVGLLDVDLVAVHILHTHIQAQALQLFHEHAERLRDARLRNRLTFDNRFIGLDTAHHVVGLDGQDLLQGVGCLLYTSRCV